MPVDPVAPLQAALEVSPDNIPLRLHLARTLADLGRTQECEQELKTALTYAPNNVEAKLALAESYVKAAKTSHAIVILEELAERGEAPPETRVLLAKLLLTTGEDRSAAAHYKEAIEADESVADPQLADALGVSGGWEEEEETIVAGRVREMTGPTDEPPEVDRPERPNIKFADVGGMSVVKEDIRMKAIYPLEQAEMFAAYGKKVGGGILMYGPPGCGKTYLARATAGEINASFISIGINDVLDMWIGQSERNLHAIFEQARRNAPCVLFFDEVDALGGRRSDMASGSSRQTINQFLSELDGVESNNDGVVILAATNAPWHVDPAFRRPGRFDRLIFVPPPDLEARAEVLEVQLRGKPQQNVDLKQAAKNADGFSGADLKAVVDIAIEAKLSEAMKTGIPLPITTADLLAARKKVKPSTQEWFATAKNYAVFSNQGGAYDDVLKYLKL
ncbi:ATP-binding protein [Blastopirellula retiformator]|uniref:ATP-dependent zinc metalloprotease FtsH n=1 Tax=Blastopirellula retiformator TaxID=2527970 RepID=A0A5C5V2D1_9BACT|nr:ATP-binding protein [Blastopirellula retiformator]TWT32764.1 ATP-dependent zinc metalloprotease FtsH [Blastopirellula retiformator]